MANPGTGSESDGSALDDLGEETSDIGGGPEDVGIPLSREGITNVGLDQIHHDAFPNQAASIIEDPVDGLPRPDDAHDIIPIPALSHASLVCIEDSTEFVEVFETEVTPEMATLIGHVDANSMGWRYGEVGVRERKAMVECVPDNVLGVDPGPGFDNDRMPPTKQLAAITPLGSLSPVLRGPFDEHGEPNERRVFSPDMVVKKFGLTWGLIRYHVKEGTLDYDEKRARYAGLRVPGGSSVEDVGVACCLVRPKREACKHFSALLTQSTTVAFEGKVAEPIDYYCGAYRTVGGAKMHIGEMAVTACTLRSPADEQSAARIAARISRKIAEGKDRTYLPMFGATPSGPPMDWSALAASFEKVAFCYAPDPDLRQGVPSGHENALFVLSADSWKAGGDTISPSPVSERTRYVVLADAAWQPPDSYYERPIVGQEQPWGAGGTGQVILRCAVDSPEFTTDEDAATWPGFRNPMLGLSLVRSAEACADALRRGLSVSVVVGDAHEQGAFFAALVVAKLTGKPALDVLKDVLEPLVGRELSTNFSYRCFLRNNAR